MTLQWTQVSELTKDTAAVWRAPGFEIIIAEEFHAELHRHVGGRWHLVGTFKALRPAQRMAEALAGQEEPPKVAKIEQPDNALTVLESILDCAYCWVAEDNDEERKLDEEWEAAHAAARHALECHNDLLRALKATIDAAEIAGTADSDPEWYTQATAAIAKAEAQK